MILTEPVQRYVESVRQPADAILAEMEAHGRRDQIPVVMPATGELLRLLALAGGARRALEVGTAIGVSTLHIARGLAADGTIVSFEIDPERHAAAGDYLLRAGVGDRVDLRLQDAREGLRGLEPGFDFAFIDGVKIEYVDYFEQVLPLLAPGAVLAVDNVLQNGRVAEPGGGELTEQIRRFNQRLLESEQFDATLTPVGDGVLVAVKR